MRAAFSLSGKDIIDTPIVDLQKAAASVSDGPGCVAKIILRRENVVSTFSYAAI
jgi:hypothetical protein